MGVEKVGLAVKGTRQDRSGCQKTELLKYRYTAEFLGSSGKLPDCKERCERHFLRPRMQTSLRDDPSRRGQPRAQDTGRGLSDTGTSSGPWTGPTPRLGLSPLPSDRLGTCSQLRWSAVARPSPPRSLHREPARAAVRRAGASCTLPLPSPLLEPSAPDVRPALALAPPLAGYRTSAQGLHFPAGSLPQESRR